jgi:hypothetical protein
VSALFFHFFISTFVLSGAGKKSGVGAAAQWNVKFECPANADLFPFISGSSTLRSLFSNRDVFFH